MRHFFITGLLSLLLVACDLQVLNNPYAPDDTENVYFASFKERPKHLDPVRSYSSDEYIFLGQIVEPPLHYHYLKRPYELEPLTATALPEISWLNAEGEMVDENSDEVEYSIYTITIQQGIKYQPHPGFVTGQSGEFIYHSLSETALSSIHTLADFSRTATRELIAQDYVFQIKRMSLPQSNSPIASIMGEYFSGMSEFSEMLKQKSLQKDISAQELRKLNYEGVKVIDRYTYRIKLKGRYPQLKYWLSMPFFAPMPWEVVQFYEQEGLAKKNISLDWYPVGTGAYMLTENNPNRRMVLTRNPNYHGAKYPQDGTDDNKLLVDANRTLPFIDKAIYSLEKEAIPYWTKFLQGYYDVSTISSDNFDQAISFAAQGDPALNETLSSKGIVLDTAVTSSLSYTGFNMLDPVIGGLEEKQKKLRRAISIALNTEEFISIFANGRGIPAHSPLPPGITGYEDGLSGMNPFVYELKNGVIQRRSIEQAKALLAEAGYPQGRNAETDKPLVLYLDVRATGVDDKARLNWLRKQFKLLGIQLVVRSTDYNRFRDKMNKGTAQIFQWGWNADYPDAENFMFLLYGANGKVLHHGENAANYANKNFDVLFEQMKNMRDSDKRLSIIKEMIKLVQEDAPWSWGYFPVSFSLHHNWLKNRKTNLMAHDTLKYLRIDVKERNMKRAVWNKPVFWPLLFLLIIFIASIMVVFFSYQSHKREKAI